MIEDVTILTLLIYAVIGIVIGLILGLMIKGRGFGWFGNLCLGLLGAFLGGLVLTLTNQVIDNNPVMNAIAATGGSTVLVVIVAILKKGR